MTGVVNKFQRILGLKVPENLKDFINACRNLLFLYLTWNTIRIKLWLETIADVAVIPAEDGLFSTENLEILLEKYKDRSFKIASITSCSNVTGIRTPYHEVAKNNAPASRTLFC
jgi:selenocysteine lyase/cysteine desulfurase